MSNHISVFTLVNLNMALAAFSIGVALFALTFLALILLAAGGTMAECRGWSCHRRSATLKISSSRVDSVEPKSDSTAVHAGAENDETIQQLRMKGFSVFNMFSKNRDSFIEFDGKASNAMVQHQRSTDEQPLAHFMLNKNQVRLKRDDIYDVTEGTPTTVTTKFSAPAKNEKVVKTTLPTVSSSIEMITSASNTVEENTNARKTTTIITGTFDPSLEPSTIEPPYQQIIAQPKCSK